MLIQCPECELQVSDKTITCPHCGYPLQPNIIKQRKPRQSNKRRRLPNGFGQISEIKNRNLRKPFRAMVTVGKTETGRPICKPLKPDAYFETYNDAYMALVEYNKNPYDLDPGITVKEVYEKWSPGYYATLKSPNAMMRSWEFCSAVYDMRVKDLRVRHIKGCMEEGTRMVKGELKSPTVVQKGNIKTLFNLLLDYALEMGAVDKNYSRDFKGSGEEYKVEKDHIIFTTEEMNSLWKHVEDTDFVDVLLIQCYSGWRPKELISLELKDVDLEKGTFTGGSKTEAGFDRTVPIHSLIRPFVEQRYKEAEAAGSMYLFNRKSKFKNATVHLNYTQYRKELIEIYDKLNLNPEHRPHDGRKTFVSLAKKYKVDEYAIKYLIGHAIADITEKVYTVREPEWLRSEIEKIK
ncbi:MAG: tyrosine-type recombinase/integrase [Lachnospiraceae bacterium]|nr:tyrosine-type recombinase/integrase [Lachnospiraceae bacterium]